MDNTHDSGFNESNMTLDETLNVTTTSSVFIHGYESVLGDNSLNCVSILSVFENSFWKDK